MNAATILQNTLQYQDIVGLPICMYIHNVCNDRQFHACSGSDFAAFLNLKPNGDTVTVRAKERLRVCYMISAIAETIYPREQGRQWAETVAKQCGITLAYYNSHRSDVRSISATKDNQNYCKTIDAAIASARNL